MYVNNSLLEAFLWKDGMWNYEREGEKNPAHTAKWL